MSTTVSYKGSVIATVSNAVKKLLTKGKYLEDDITITDSGGGGSAVLETLQVAYTPSETAISDTQTPSQGYDGFDEAQISVAAIPSSYVGSGITRRDSTDLSAVGDTVTAPAGYYENAGSKAVPAGSVTAPATITGTNADKFLGSGRLALQKAVNVTPVVSTPGYVNEGTAGESTVLLASDIIVESAQDYHPSTQDQTIAANKYLYGAQTIKAVTMTNLIAANIKSGVTIKVGDDTDDDCVTAVTGTYTGGSEVEFVEYISTDGNAYIDTGVKANQTSIIDAVFYGTATSSILYGCASSGNSASVSLVVNGSSASNSRFGNRAVSKAIAINTLTNSHQESATLVVNSTSSTYSSVSSFTTPKSLLLGAMYNSSGGVDSWHFVGRIYHFRHIRDNEIVFDGRPAKKNNVYGIYDMVSKSFLSSITGTNFTGKDYS